MASFRSIKSGVYDREERKQWLKERKLNIFVEPRIRSELLHESSDFDFITTWKDAHDCITGDANRVRRHLSMDAACKECNDLHILRDCSAARDVWSQFLQGRDLVEFFHGTLKDCLHRNLRKQGGWLTVFAYGLWWIWRWRNSRVFDCEVRVVGSKREFIVARAREYLSAKMTKSNGGGHENFDVCRMEEAGERLGET